MTTDGANIDVDGSNSKWLSKPERRPVRQPFLNDATHVTNDGNYVKGNQFGCGQSCGDRQWASSKIGKDNLTSVLAFKDGKACKSLVRLCLKMISGRMPLT